MADELKPMTEEDLLTVIDSYVTEGLDYQQSKLSGQIEKSIKYYYGEPLGNEIQGRSSVVSKDVADAVDWLMPSLMRIFAGGKEVVQFVPETKDDIEVAKQAQDYCNYLYNVKNDGFLNTYSVIQDSLLAKNGIMKHYYQEKIKVEFDSFSGLSQDQIALILLEDGVELLAQTALPEGTYDIEISRQVVCKELMVEAIPPEEFIIDTWSATVDEASFVGHRRLVSRSELVSMGYDAEMVQGLDATNTTWLSGGNGNSITRARNSYDNAQFQGTGTVSWPQEDSQEKVEVIEGVTLVDFDGDGIAERRRVVVADGNLLLNERYDEPLFTDFRTHIIAHKFYGLSMYDQLKDIQKIKTSLLRNLLDNMYTMNNGRYEVLEGQVNMDDLLNNRLGGVIRTKMAGAIKQLDTPALPTENFTMLEYLDTLKDNRTGISKTTRGMDSSILHSNQAGSAVADVMSAAEQKQELIARVLAHSFSKLFRNIYKLTLLHQDQEVMFQVRGDFVTTNPTHWRKDYRITPVAGIGDGKVAEKVMASQMMLNLTTSLAQQGMEGILFDYETVYNSLVAITKNSGFDEPHLFWLNPNSPESKQAQAALEQKRAQPTPEQIKLQLEQQKLELEAKKAQEEAAIKREEIAVRNREAAVKERELDIDQQKVDIDRAEYELKYATNIAELQMELEQGRRVSIGDTNVPNPRDGDLANS